MASKKLKKESNSKIKLDKPKGKETVYTLAEWQALTVDERLEIAARALELIK